MSGRTTRATLVASSVMSSDGSSGIELDRALRRTTLVSAGKRLV